MQKATRRKMKIPLTTSANSVMESVTEMNLTRKFTSPVAQVLLSPTVFLGTSPRPAHQAPIQLAHLRFFPCRPRLRLPILLSSPTSPHVHSSALFPRSGLNGITPALPLSTNPHINVWILK